MGILPILKNAKKKFRAVLRPKMLNFQIWLLYYLNAQGKSLSAALQRVQPGLDWIGHIWLQCNIAFCQGINIQH